MTATQNYQKRYLNTREAAEYLGITPNALNQMCAKKRLRYYKPRGKNCFFDIADIEDYITSGEVIEPEQKHTPDDAN